MKIRKKPVVPKREIFDINYYGETLTITSDPWSYHALCEHCYGLIRKYNAQCGAERVDPDWFDYTDGFILARESESSWYKKQAKYEADLADWEQWYRQNRAEIERIQAERTAKRTAAKAQKAQLRQTRQQVLAKLSPIERKALGFKAN